MTDSPLCLRLRSAFLLQASALAAHGVAGLALLLSASPVWVTVLGAVLLSVSVWRAWQAEQAKSGVRLLLMADGRMLVSGPAGEPKPAVLTGALPVFAQVLWLALVDPSPAGKTSPRWRVMLVRANVCDGKWRELQVWLRHRSISASASSAGPWAA